MIARLVLLLILLLFRFYDLGVRPPHHDEAVNGWFVDGLLNRGYYVYDPQNYHGPLFFYVLTLFEQIFGRNVESLRASTVIFGSLLCVTPFLFRKWLGNTAAWIAAFILAVSPALVFYSRYAIHETPFVLATILFFYYWLRIRDEGMRGKNIAGFGITLGVMAGLKENFVLFGASLGLAEVLLWLHSRKTPVTFNRRFWLGLLAGTAIASVIILITYTGFFQDPNGIQNFFKAFALWFQTGEKGNGHQKPFEYWLKIMGALEWYALLGLLLVPLPFFKKAPEKLRLVGVLCTLLWLLYSVVAYKTPWCLLSFYWGLIFVTAYWAATWIKSQRFLVGGLGTLGLLISAYQAFDVAYAHPDQEGHYYIYGQTFHDMMIPLGEIVERGRLNPALHASLRIQVLSAFTWPLPYVLGEFKQVGYFGEANTPAVLDGDEVIMDKTFEERFAPRIKGNYTRREYRSRQWAAPMVFFHRNSP